MNISYIPKGQNAYLRKVAASSLLNSVVSALATAIFLPLVIGQIGMDNYGIWAVLGLFVGITSLLDFGVWKSLVYFGARGQYSFSQLFSSAFVMCFVAAGVFSSLLLVAIVAGMPVFGDLVGNEANLKWYLAVAGMLIVLSGLITNLARGALESKYQIHWVNIGFALLTFLQYAMAAIVARWSHDVRLLIEGTAAVYVVVLLLHYASMRIIIGVEWSRPSFEIMKAMLKYGASTFLADIPSILLAPSLSYLFVLVADKAGDFGVFDLSVRISTLAMSALSMMSTPFFAMVAGAHADGQEMVRGLMGRYLRLNVILGALGWVTFLFVGPFLIKAFFPARPDDIHRATLIILSGAVLVAIMEPVTRMLMGLGRLHRLAMVRFAMLFSALFFVWFLNSRLPLERFSIACGVGYLVCAVGLLWLNRLEAWGRDYLQAK